MGGGGQVWEERHGQGRRMREVVRVGQARGAAMGTGSACSVEREGEWRWVQPGSACSVEREREWRWVQPGSACSVEREGEWRCAERRPRESAVRVVTYVGTDVEHDERIRESRGVDVVAE
jgi:hypothetical protein